MTAFAIGQPITTREATVSVDAGLSIGRHRFRLEVVDSTGLRSVPDDAVIEVQRVVIGPTDPVGPLSPRVPLDPVVTRVTPVRAVDATAAPRPRRARRKKDER